MVDTAVARSAPRPGAVRARAIVNQHERVARVVHVVSLVFGFAFVLVENRHQWFMDDDFEFLTRRGVLHATNGLFEPHNEHWSTIPILVYRGLYSVFGLHHHLAFVVPMALLHVLAAHVLWRLSLRAGVDMWLATGLVAVFLVLGAGSENLLWAFQIGFVGSVALGLVVIDLIDHVGPFGRRDLVAVGLAVVALTFSGITVTMVATATIVALLRRGWRIALTFAAAPAVVYVVWFGLVGREGLSSSYSSSNPLLDMPSYLWKGLTAALGTASGFEGAGGVLVLALLVVLIRRDLGVGSIAATPVGMALGAVVLYVIIGSGRSGLGPDQAMAPRYVYTAIALLLPAIGWALTRLTAKRTAQTVAVLCVVGLAGLHNIAVMRAAADDRGRRAQAGKRVLVAAADLLRSSPQLPGPPDNLSIAPDLTARTIRALDADGAIPRDVAVTPVDQLNARAGLLVAATRDPAYPVDPAAVTLTGTARSRVEPDPAAPGCFVASSDGPEAQLVLHHSSPASLAVTPSRTGTLKVVLLDQGSVSDNHELQLHANRTVWVDEGRDAGDFLLTIPAAGTTQVCNVTDGRS